MKIIFLDVDGVLNCFSTKERTKSGRFFVEEQFIKRIKKIIDETDAMVVLSSDLRFTRCEPYPNPEFYELRDKLAEYEVYIIDTTPEIEIEDVTRGEEIQAWIKKRKNNLENFVILDNRTDIEPYMSHLVHIKNGIKDKHVNLAIKILNKGDT